MSAKKKKPSRRWSDVAGLGVDALGGPVVDPTANVIALNEASIKRIDDMNVLFAKLAEREAFWTAEISKLRADYQEKLDTLEAKRLDAVRSVDQLAVKTEADRSAAAITALASSAATTAETLRNAVNTSATNLATQLTNTVNSITERIASLEKLSYTGQGRQAVVDPQMTDLVMEMRKLSAARDVGTGKTEGIGASWGVLLAVVGVIATLLAIGGVAVTLVLFLNRAPAPVAAVAPVPAPAPVIYQLAPVAPLPNAPPPAGR